MDNQQDLQIQALLENTLSEAEKQVMMSCLNESAEARDYMAQEVVMHGMLQQFSGSAVNSEAILHVIQKRGSVRLDEITIQRLQSRKKVISISSSEMQRLQQRRSKKIRRSPLRKVMAFAAVFLLLLSAGWLARYIMTIPAPDLYIAGKTPQFIQRSHPLSSLMNDQGLYIGDEVISGHEGVSLAYPDGTIIQLMGEARILIVAGLEGEKKLILRKGKLLCDVRPQERPMQIQTPFGSVKVLGTRFGVEADGQVMRVAVQRGLVEVTDVDRSVNLSAGQSIESGSTRLLTSLLNEGFEGALESIGLTERDIASGNIITTMQGRALCLTPSVSREQSSLGTKLHVPSAADELILSTRIKMNRGLSHFSLCAATDNSRFTYIGVNRSFPDGPFRFMTHYRGGQNPLGERSGQREIGHFPLEEWVDLALVFEGGAVVGYVNNESVGKICDAPALPGWITVMIHANPDQPENGLDQRSILVDHIQVETMENLNQL